MAVLITRSDRATARGSERQSPVRWRAISSASAVAVCLTNRCEITTRLVDFASLSPRPIHRHPPPAQHHRAAPAAMTHRDPVWIMLAFRPRPPQQSRPRTVPASCLWVGRRQTITLAASARLRLRRPTPAPAAPPPARPSAATSRRTGPRCTCWAAASPTASTNRRTAWSARGRSSAARAAHAGDGIDDRTTQFPFIFRRVCAQSSTVHIPFWSSLLARREPGHRARGSKFGCRTGISFTCRRHEASVGLSPFAVFALRACLCRPSCFYRLCFRWKPSVISKLRQAVDATLCGLCAEPETVNPADGRVAVSDGGNSQSPAPTPG
jgi:hypothetical protein